MMVTLEAALDLRRRPRASIIISPGFRPPSLPGAWKEGSDNRSEKKDVGEVNGIYKPWMNGNGNEGILVRPPGKCTQLRASVWLKHAKSFAVPLICCGSSILVKPEAHVNLYSRMYVF